jgi:hypothetical protein
MLIDSRRCSSDTATGATSNILHTVMTFGIWRKYRDTGLAGIILNTQAIGAMVRIPSDTNRLRSMVALKVSRSCVLIDVHELTA